MLDYSISSLNFSNCSQITDIGCRYLIKKSPNLKKLVLSNCCRIGNEGLVEIAFGLSTNLESLDISNCKIGNFGLQQISKHCSNLTWIDLSNGGKLLSSSLNKLFENCKKLETLILKDCTQINDSAFENLPFSISNIHLIGCESLKDSTLNFITEKCLKLHSFSISSKFITDNGMTKLLNKFSTNLTQIELKDCELITDKTLITMINECSNLEILNLSGTKQLTDQGFSKTTNEIFPFLRQLDLSFNINISDQTLTRISKNCLFLEKLNFSHCDITDSSLIPILKNCTNLNQLFLSKCTKLTKDSFERFPMQISGLHLYGTNISENWNIQTNLLELNISYCLQLTNNGLDTILLKSPLLQSLCLDDCTQFNEATLSLIPELCFNLKSIYFPGKLYRCN